MMEIAAINDSRDFVKLYMKLARDTMDGTVTPEQANAAAKVGTVVLKMIELNMQWGERELEAPAKPLQLGNGTEEESEPEETPINRSGVTKYPKRAPEEVINGAFPEATAKSGNLSELRAT